MQTFLPDPDFAETARLLDTKRLGKQRVEALQIFRALTREVYGWKFHPAVLMWAGYEEALGSYALAMCSEWRRRGHSDTVQTTIVDELRAHGVEPVRSQEALRAAGQLPLWLCDEQFHLSHRSALVRKDPDHYRPLFPNTPEDLPYVWPVRREKPAKAPRATTGRRSQPRAPRGGAGQSM